MTICAFIGFQWLPGNATLMTAHCVVYVFIQFTEKKYALDLLNSLVNIGYTHIICFGRNSQNCVNCVKQYSK